MNLETEQFRMLLKEFKKGKSSNIYPLIEACLPILNQELEHYSVHDGMIHMGLLSLIQGIKSYSYEKSTSFTQFITDYIHFSLLMAVGMDYFIKTLDFDIFLPSYQVVIPNEKLQNYVAMIRENHNEILKNKEKIRKMS